MKTLEERFWSKVVKLNAADGGCWMWTGSRFREGYGDYRSMPGVFSAHRVAWILCNGPIPAGLEVLHGCDNPSCVNAEDDRHLFLGTQTDNVADCVSKGRRRYSFGSDKYNAKLSEDDVAEIRSIYASGSETIRSMADRFGVSDGHICTIAQGKVWKHVAGSTRKRGHKRKLSDDQVVQVLALLSGGMTQREVAKQFGLFQTTISAIRTGKTYRNLLTAPSAP